MPRCRVPDWRSSSAPGISRSTMIPTVSSRSSSASPTPPSRRTMTRPPFASCFAAAVALKPSPVRSTPALPSWRPWVRTNAAPPDQLLEATPYGRRLGFDVTVLRVFTDSAGNFGNPLGVVDASTVELRQHQPLATQLGYSETVFVDLP